jgi:hypothetical protein
MTADAGRRGHDGGAIRAEDGAQRDPAQGARGGAQGCAALHWAVTLSLPDAWAPSPYGTFDGDERQRQYPKRSESFPPVGARQRMSWNDLIEQVFHRDDDGQIVLRSA